MAGIILAQILLTLLLMMAIRKFAADQASAISRQSSELREELAEALRRVDAGLDTVRTLESTQTRFREEVDQRLNELAIQFRNQAMDLRELVGSHSDRLPARDSRSAVVAAVVSNSIDWDVLRQKTEPEMVALAEAVATVRPLVPYPNWHFDADWSNPDLAFQLRRSIWQYFRDRGSTAPVEIAWHHGTQLALHLGNDLSRQIYIGGCIDPNEFAFLDRFLRPGMTFLDIGANEGIYSVFAAKRVGSEGTVWAFEPSRRELARLQTNVDLNGLPVRIFPVALADRKGSAELNVAGDEHAGQNTLGAFIYDIEPAGKETVDMARLDDLMAQNRLARLDVIKADVEGAETPLFRGAIETLHRYRPILILEVLDPALRTQGSSAQELLDFLRSHEYRFFGFDICSGLPSPIADSMADGNIVAVPNEKTLPEAVLMPWPAGTGV